MINQVIKLIIITNCTAEFTKNAQPLKWYEEDLETFKQILQDVRVEITSSDFLKNGTKVLDFPFQPLSSLDPIKVGDMETKFIKKSSEKYGDEVVKKFMKFASLELGLNNYAIYVWNQVAQLEPLERMKRQKRSKGYVWIQVEQCCFKGWNGEDDCVEYYSFCLNDGGVRKIGKSRIRAG